jgi:hypothetical protein
MNNTTEKKTPIFVSLKSICNELGVSRSTVFRVINAYKLKFKTETIPGKHLTILGSHIFEKTVFIEWFRSIFIISAKITKPVDLFKHQKLSILNGETYEKKIATN